MISLTKNTLCAVVEGRSIVDVEDYPALRLEYDSREIRGGELFVGLRGEGGHGNDYATEAFSRGASLFLLEEGFDHSSFPEPGRVVLVKDSLRAFHRLAAWWRDQLPCPIVAITGSIGKTSVKEFSSQLLLSQSVGNYAPGSFNNHVGLPYSLCRTSREHAWAVLELGMNHAGEISTLTAICRPDIAVITGIAPVHTESFDSVEAIARAKLEILEGLKPGGVCIMPADDPYLQSAIEPAKARFTVYTFSESAPADVVISSVTSEGVDGIRFDLDFGSDTLQVHAPIPGIKSARNIAIASLIAREILGSGWKEVVETGISQLRLPNMRLAKIPLGDGKTIINDAYNASPQSMDQLLELARFELKRGKTVGLILGDMLELGDAAPGFHRELGEAVAELSPTFVIYVGEFSDVVLGPIQKASIPHFPCDTAEAAGLTALKCSFDLLMVKGSRGIGLEKAISVILEGGMPA